MFSWFPCRLRGLNWTKVGLKVGGVSTPGNVTLRSLNWTKVGLKDGRSYW